MANVPFSSTTYSGDLQSDSVADQAVARAVRQNVSRLSKDASSKAEFIIGGLAGLAASSSIQNSRLRRATVSYISNMLATGYTKNDSSSSTP